MNTSTAEQLNDLDHTLLKGYLEAEEVVQANYRIASHIKAFEKIYGGWSFLFYHDPTITDDNAIIIFYEKANYPFNPSSRAFYIINNDDPYYIPFVLQPSQGFFASHI